MLFRMLLLERSPSATLDRPLRQIFVTQSRVLASRVKEYFTQLSETLDAGLKSRAEIKAMFEAKLKAGEEHEDGKAEIDLVELDEENESGVDLPSRWSELEEKHFPLFVTFDQVRLHSHFLWLPLEPTRYPLVVQTSRRRLSGPILEAGERSATPTCTASIPSAEFIHKRSARGRRV